MLQLYKSKDPKNRKLTTFIDQSQFEGAIQKKLKEKYLPILQAKAIELTELLVSEQLTLSDVDVYELCFLGLEHLKSLIFKFDVFFTLNYCLFFWGQLHTTLIYN